MEKTEDPIEFASRLCFPADPGTPAVQNARGRSGTFDNSRCNHVIIARERIAVGALAGSWSHSAHSIHHGNWVCAPFLRVLTQSKRPLTSASGGAHGAGAPFFLQAKKDSHDVAQLSRLCHGRYFRGNRWRAARSKDTQFQTCHCPELLRVIPDPWRVFWRRFWYNGSSRT